MLVSEYGIFLLKVVTILIAVIVFLVVLFALKSKAKLNKRTGELIITDLSEQFFITKIKMLKNAGDKKEVKNLLKEFKKKQKLKDKQAERTFILKFKGDMKAEAVTSLRKEISAILSIAKKTDNVALILESPGGVVNGYGLAASELDRFRKRCIHLTILVDKTAASGGYMMACVADKIIAAPFAIIGSIGVLAQVPNFNKLLTDKGVDFEQITSGKYKRTVTMFGKNTDADRKKLQSDLDDIHFMFKNFIKERRSHLNIEEVATGEFWLAAQAKDLGLVDELMTSDDYLMQLNSADKSLFLVEYKQHESVINKLSNTFANMYNAALYPGIS